MMIPNILSDLLTKTAFAVDGGNLLLLVLARAIDRGDGHPLIAR